MVSSTYCVVFLHWFSSSCVSYGASFSGCTCHRCSGRVSSSCSTSGTHRVSLVTNPVISREWGKDREMFTTSGTYPWSFVIQIFHNGQTGHVKFSNVIKGLMSNLWFSGFFPLFDPWVTREWTGRNHPWITTRGRMSLLLNKVLKRETWSASSSKWLGRNMVQKYNCNT